jgi:hypothetical protein
VLAGLQAGLVQPVEGAPRAWTFRHDLVRQTLYLALGGQERARAHLSVARAMQRMAGHRPAPVEQVAHHLRAAWPLCAADEVAAHLLTAAETPVALLDPATSAQLCTHALDALALDPESDENLRNRVLVARGTALADALDIPAARDSLSSAIRVLSSHPDSADLLADAVAAYVDTWRDRTVPAEVAAQLLAVAADARLGLSPARCDAVAMLHALDPPQAAKLAAELAAEARRDLDVDGEHRLLTATWRWQQPIERQATILALHELSITTGSAAIGADAAVRRAITAAQLGEALLIPTAGVPIRPAASAGEALGQLWAITAHIATGWFDRARDGIVACGPRVGELAALLRARPARVATVLLRQSVQLATFTGRSDDTVLLAPAVNVRDIPVDLDSGAINTIIRARRGEANMAREVCAMLVTQAEPVLMSDRVAEYASLALACVETGYEEGLPRSMAKLAPSADLHVVRGEHLYVGPVRHRLAQWAQLQGRLGEAAALFERAAQQCALIGARPWEIRAQLAQADVLRLAGDHARADRIEDAAEALAASFGMATRHEVGEFLPPDGRRPR